MAFMATGYFQALPKPQQSKADKRRRQCLLEIEHELLRHSSSDEEGCGGDDMQLPNPSAGKRSKSACTG